LKRKKTISIIIAAGAGVLLIISVFVFPFLLAATPDNMEVETIESENVYPTDENEQYDETDEYDELDEMMSITITETERLLREHANILADINAISEERAIEIVNRIIYPGEGTSESPKGETRSNKYELLGARYVEAADPMDDPVWQVFLLAQSSGVSFYYPEDGRSASELLVEVRVVAISFQECCEKFSLGRDLDGEMAVFMHFDTVTLIVMELNAFTGDLIGQGWIDICEHNDPGGRFQNAAGLDWDTIMEYMELMDYSVLTPEPPPVPVVPSPQPGPESTQDPPPIPGPVPTPEPSPRP